MSSVRVPLPVVGDFEAQVTANEVGVRRVDEFLGDVGLADIQGLAEAIQVKADAAMRRAISAVPDGTYRSTLEADGFDERTRNRAPGPQARITFAKILPAGTTKSFTDTPISAYLSPGG